MKPASVTVVVPIYRPLLDPLEQFSLDRSFTALSQRAIAFVGPRSLDRSHYSARYPGIAFHAFDDRYFESIRGYNLLLLSEGFHARFADREFMLVLQTDAIVLRDELDAWCDKPYDYVGAPWPDGYSLLVNAGPFAGEYGKMHKVMVGNGGFSLRRVHKCAALLREFPDIVRVFERSGSSEDLFFSVMGALSNDFVLPNEIVASCFSLELKPAYYFHVNGGRLPMGGHAWWKFDPAFWRALLPEAPWQSG